MTDIRFLGQSCFELSDGDARVVVDPFLVPNNDAATAADLIGAPTVIPMHYNTFPLIEADAEAFKADVESRSSSTVVILQPGDTHTV